MDKGRAGHRQSKCPAIFETTNTGHPTHDYKQLNTTHDSRHLKTTTDAQTPYTRQSATIDSRNHQQ